MRRAATDRFFKTLDGRRAAWRNNLDELNEELVVLAPANRAATQTLGSTAEKVFPSKKSKLGRDDQKKRVFAQLERWIGQEKSYTEYVRTLTILFALRTEDFAPANLKIEDADRQEGDGRTQ